mgnify:CR=1 FL=1
MSDREPSQRADLGRAPCDHFEALNSLYVQVLLKSPAPVRFDVLAVILVRQVVAYHWFPCARAAGSDRFRYLSCQRNNTATTLHYSLNSA